MYNVIILLDNLTPNVKYRIGINKELKAQAGKRHFVEVTEQHKVVEYRVILVDL